ncbi:apoptosis-inducing factor 2 [Podospora australis]|uniref:Apoptosis-inducing factor 2 n=1 Tax=Podospora australis TaxID=1536484 RepID=A0AAN6WQN8_9PEZI|nr:apoptosis-inducing factor 2 [Podospora australis]
MGSMFESTPQVAAMPFRVLVVGGSYGGLSAALNLQDLCRGLPARCGPKPKEGEEVTVPQFNVDITIVDERDGFFHLIGSPLALADEEYAAKTWIKYEDIPALQTPNIHVLHGSVKSVDQQRKVATYAPHGSTTEFSELPYDYLVAAAGLRRVWPVVPQSLRRKQFLFEAGDHIRAATTARHGVLIVGGGAVGIEMAAELKLVHPELKVTLAHSREKLLSSEPLPDDVKDRSLELLREANVEVLMSHRLSSTEETKDDRGNKCYRVTFTNGHSFLADQVAMAISRSVPATTFLSPNGVLDEEGYVKIQPSLNFPVDSPNSADHFAIGDLVKWSGIKRCGGAMHMGCFAAINIHQRMIETSTGAKPTLSQLDEIPPMIGLAVGKKAVSYWPQSGVSSGEDVMQLFFGDDLGFTICWNHLGLGDDKQKL